MSIQVTYETDNISLLHDSTMLNALFFCFLCILLYLKKKDHIRRIINSKKKEGISAESELLFWFTEN